VWHACAFYDRDWFILFTDQSLLDGCFSGFPVFLGLFTETLREPVTVGSLFRIRTILTRAIIVSVFAPVALFGTRKRHLGSFAGLGLQSPDMSATVIVSLASSGRSRQPKFRYLFSQSLGHLGRTLRDKESPCFFTGLLSCLICWSAVFFKMFDATVPLRKRFVVARRFFELLASLFAV
jgi:hypothetical protein